MTLDDSTNAFWRHGERFWPAWLGHPCKCAPDCAERVTCDRAGDLGHGQCGWCDGHGVARHRCGCIIKAGDGAR